MTWARKTAAAFRAAHRTWTKKWAFLGLFLLVFYATFLLLQGLDLVPNPLETASANGAPEISLSASPLVAENRTATVLSPSVSDAGVLQGLSGELPVKIEIPTIGLEAVIKNPAKTDIATLDKALLAGAVRYPTSAKLGEEGNLILFGHSSYLPIVNNSAFKAFNEIQKLAVGDEVTVYSDSSVYTYVVEEVTSMDADDAAIPLSVEGAKLTLSTCDSFGEKSDRFVVVASLVDSHPVKSP
ncbi:MAG: hypothetical protein RIQ56_1002 [Candidatus Parcubacteria bacterium]|jgi:LPXTG-site transpeptidase (sortase) family protein